MSTQQSADFRQRVETAAYALLATVGYHNASMQAIAEHAEVSPETLYRLYGSQQELIRSLIVANAVEAPELSAISRDEPDPIRTLYVLGPALLKLVTGERAVILSRAAAADVHNSDTLGAEIARFGRDTITAWLHDIMRRLLDQGLIACDHPSEAAETYLNLLVGDLQIRRTIGVMEPLSDDAAGLRAARALHCSCGSTMPTPGTAADHGARHDLRASGKRSLRAPASGRRPRRHWR